VHLRNTSRLWDPQRGLSGMALEAEDFIDIRKNRHGDRPKTLAGLAGIALANDRGLRPIAIRTASFPWRHKIKKT